ncbi:translation initiation factor IF-2 [Microbispora sp. RL4-1S]|uniref:Translation initiation factor IF-2 n=1 Tax=Microbispora oryzae TaxID=2806554 RepID=A0A941ASH8_9ACTN|nr:translation initiation factor IF-2 [Microbispora oryzae]MBP2708374.1 translation initiation factor IF-2 [Microbispora oryzae]
MRRITLIALSLLVTGGCGVATYAKQYAKQNATDDLRDRALRIAHRFYSGRDRPAQDMGHLVDEVEGVEVMSVTGTTTAQGDGVGVVIRLSGTASEGAIEPRTVPVARCFELRFSTFGDWDAEPRDAVCPTGPPLTFAPWPKTPRMPYERLREALPRVPAHGRADERKVRAAVASLHLDPAIRIEIKTEGGVVGVSFSVKPYLDQALDCILARVAPGATDVWSPSRIQRMPGEGGCDVGNAIHPMPPPH